MQQSHDRERGHKIGTAVAQQQCFASSSIDLRNAENTGSDPNAS